MALLAFRVEADYQEAIACRNELYRLESMANNMKLGSEEWKKVQRDISATRSKLNGFVEDAVKYGAEIEQKFTKEIVNASNSMSELQTKIKDTGESINESKRKIAAWKKEMRELNKSGVNTDDLRKKIKAENNKRIDLGKLKAKYEIEYSETKGNRDIVQHRLDSLRTESSQRAVTLNLADPNGMRDANKEGDKMVDWLTKAGTEGKKLKTIFTDMLSSASGVALGSLAANGLMAGYSQVKSMADHAINVRKDMQDIESNMSVFLKSKDKAASFTRDLEAEAYYNMNEFSQLVSASKEMIAYGNKVEEIIPRIHQLSEIATGTGQNMNMLVAMYNRAKSVGYVDSRAQQTWASNGIVLQDQLRAMGETVSSKVTFEQLNKVIDRMTSEGGMFYGVMSDMMSNISSEEGQLEDNLHTMYNEMGKMMQEPYIKTLKFQEEMVKNWHTIYEWVVSAVSAIGSYRAGLVLAHTVHEAMSGEAGSIVKRINEWAEALEKANANGEAVKSAYEDIKDAVDEVKDAQDKIGEVKEIVENVSETKEELAEAAATGVNTVAKEGETKAEGENAAAKAINTKETNKNTASEGANTIATEGETLAKGQNTEATLANAGAQNALGASLKRLAAAWLKNLAALATNPYVLAAAAIAAVTFAVVKAITAMSAEEQVAKDTAEALKEHAAAMKESRDEETSLANDILNTNLSMEERIKKLRELKKATEDIEVPEEKDLTTDIFTLDPKEAQQKVNAYMEEVNKALREQQKTNLTDAVDLARKYQGKETVYSANRNTYEVGGISKSELKEDFSRMVEINTPEWLDPDNEDGKKIMKEYLSDTEKMLEYIQQMGVQNRQQLRDAETAAELELQRTMSRKEYYEHEKKNIEEKKKELALVDEIVAKELSNNNDSDENVIGRGYEKIVSATDNASNITALKEDSEKLKSEMYELYEQAMNAEGEDRVDAEKLYNLKVNEFKAKMKELGVAMVTQDYLAEQIDDGNITSKDAKVKITTEMLLEFMGDDEQRSVLERIYGKGQAEMATEIKVKTSIVEGKEDGAGNYKPEKTIKQSMEAAKKEYKNFERTLKQLKTGNVSAIDQKIIDGVTGVSKTLQREYRLILQELKEGKDVADSDKLELLEYLQTEMSTKQSEYKTYGGDEAEKAAQRAYEARKMMAETEKKISRERVANTYAEEENVIKAMVEGAEKNRRQRELDHKKEMTQIEEQHEDALKAAEDTLKSYWLKLSDGNKEVNWEGAKKAMMEQNQMYKELVLNANAAYEAKKREAEFKYGDTSNLRSMYDKEMYDYEKKSGELASNLQKLYEDRENTTAKIAEKNARLAELKSNENALTEEEKKEYDGIVDEVKNYEKHLESVGRMIEDATYQQKTLLTLTQKTAEEYVKNYGTAEQKIAQINRQYDRNLQNENLNGAHRASNEMQRNAALKKVYEDSIKEEKDYVNKRLLIYDEYAHLVTNIDKQIADNNAKIQSENVSQEEKESLSTINTALEEQRKRLREENRSSLVNVSMDALKQDPTYFMAFRDMTQLSNAQLEELNEKLVANADALKDLPPDQLKTITDLLDKMDGVISDRDPFLALSKHTKEATEAQAELIAAQNDEKEAIIEIAQLEAELAQLQTDLEQGIISKDVFDARVDQLKGELDTANEKKQGAHNRTLNAMTELANANSRVKKDTDAIYDKIKDWGNLLKDIGGQVGGIFGEILGACGDVVNAFMDVTKQLNNAMQGLDKAASAANNANGGNSAQDVGNAAGEVAKNAKAGSSMSKVASGAASVMAGFQAGMSVGSSLVNLFEKTGVTGQAKYERYARKQAEINKLTSSINDYRRAAILAQQAEDHWFGNSSLRDLQDQWKVAQQSQKNYFDKLNERQAAYRDQSKHDGDWLGNVIVGSLAGAVTGAAVTGWSGPGAIVGAIVGGLAGGVAGATTSYAEQALGNSSYDKQLKKAQDNLRIETQKKHRSFMWFGGQNQKTADLRTWAREKYGDELFDKDGWINKELAESIITDYGDKLQGETQKTMEELIKLKDEYDEYQKSLKEYVNSLYSPLTDGMVDAIWAWYDEGRDALAAFRDSAKDTFRQIVNDLMKQIVLSNIVGTFQDDIKELYDKKNAGSIDYATLMRQVGLKTKEMTDAYESSVPMLQDMVTTMSETIKETTGIDISDTSNRSNGGASNGFASMSQDTGNEMNGRLTVIQLQGEATIGQLTTLNNTALSMLTAYSEHGNSLEGIQQQIANSYLEVQGIHEDTTAMDKKLKVVGEYLFQWDQYIKKL